MSERDPLCGAAGGLDRGAGQVLSVIPADEIQHGFGVAKVMRAEARDRIEAQFEIHAKRMRDRPGIEPELVVREGDPGAELLAQIAEDLASQCRCWRPRAAAVRGR